MSLVNKMLKDLEKNHQQEGGDGAYQDGSGGPPPPPAHKSHRLLYGSIIATAVIIIVIVSAVIKFRQQPATAASTTRQKATATSTESSAKPADTNIKKTAESTATQQTATSSPSTTVQGNDDKSTMTTSNSTNSTEAQQSTNDSHPPATPGEEHNQPADSEHAQSDHESSNHESSDNMAKSASEDKSAQQIRIDQPPLNEKQLLTNQYNEAMKEIHDGHNDQAIHRLSDLLQQAPTYKNARVSLAALLIQQQKIEQATHTLKQGLNQHPKDPDYVKLYAHILVQQGQTGEALKLLTIAKPNNIDAGPSYFALMASLYMQQQDYRNAKNIYQHLVVKQPLNGTWWAGLGIAADKLGLTMEARKAFSRANKIGGLPPSLQKYIDKEASALEP